MGDDIRIFYVDPQSYMNLAVYDYSLISNMKKVGIAYYANERYSHRTLENAEIRKVFRYSRHGSAIRKLCSYAGSMMRILRDAARERPDIIHIQWIRFWPLDYLLVFLFHFLGIKVVHTAHNVLPHIVHAGDKTMYRLYYRAIDQIIVHSERTKKELEDMAGCQGKVHVIHHGILATQYDKERCPARVRELMEKHHIGKDTVVFSCLGLQNTYKGTDMVFKVWTESQRIAASDSVLMVVGKNENVDYSPVAGTPSVHIVSEKVSDLDFNAYMHMSSVILLPYRTISQSGVLFSAIQAGVPVLVSDVGGLAEPLEIANIGWNIGRPSEENLRAAMEGLCGDKRQTDSRKQDAAAFEKVRQAYEWPAISEKTERLYVQMMAR